MSATTSSTSSSASSSGGSSSASGQINVPTSTVVAIGVAFVCSALLLLLTSLLFRVRRIRRSARSQRRQGGNTTFHDVWEREGGWWGFLHAGPGSGQDRVGIGAGMFGEDVTRLRRLRDILAMLEDDGKEVKAPNMYEVWLPASGADMRGVDGVDSAEEYMPLCMSTSVPPKDTAQKAEAHPEPDVTLSVLLLMPSQGSGDPERIRRSIEDEDWQDLPDLVVGTTTLIPIIQVPSQVTRQLSPSPIDQHGKKGQASVEEVEFAGGWRRADWEKTRDGSWRIEGLG